MLVVANDLARSLAGIAQRCPQADEDCLIAAVEMLQECREKQVVVIDDVGEVLALYRSKMSGSGQPGSGDAFFRYLSESQYNPKRVGRVAINKHAVRGYEEFPDSDHLQDFDSDDRIYVAIALAGGPAEIVNCVDSDWTIFGRGLQAAGVRVRELCPSCVKSTS